VITSQRLGPLSPQSIVPREPFAGYAWLIGELDPVLLINIPSMTNSFDNEI
jgi:hypothetical protein